MNEEFLEVLKDICSELTYSNILKCYDLKLKAQNPSVSATLRGETCSVANEYLNHVEFDKED